MKKLNIREPMKIGVRVGIGIVVIVAIMILLTVAGINYMFHVNSRMRDIFENNIAKLEASQIMHNALRERALSMYYMIIIKDDFVRDEEMQRFNSLAAQYYFARTTMEKLAATDEERKIISKIVSLTNDTRPITDKIMESMSRGNPQKHYEAIRNFVLPQQKLIREQMVKLVNLQNKLSADAIKEEELLYNYARKIMWISAALTSLLVILIATLVSRKVGKQAREMERQAFYDELTGLPNRALFMDRLAHAVALSNRDKLPFAIMLLDLDRFKEVNDILGHHMGDQLLQEVSTRLNGVVRQSDTVARLGGDEFVIILQQIKLEYIEDVAEKLIKILDRPFKLADQMVDVSASIGLAYYPEHGNDMVSILQKADVAMYAAKRNRSGYEIYAGGQMKSARTDLAFKSEMLKAIEHDELVLHFQPKIDFMTGKVVSVEALVRWQHPGRGYLPPDMFIPMAEETGTINQLTFWVLKKTLLQCGEFVKAGMNITAAVNFSARSLHDLRLPGEVARMLGETGIKPAMLVLEITESAVMSDPKSAMEILGILDNMDINLSIDDFGTGYSSLAYLSKLPIDEIKIDKSFVLGMVKDRQAAIIVRSTIELGHSLGKKVVAEGVENQEMWDQLLEWGCDTAQGYHMSKPLPADQLMFWLRESRWKK